MLKKLTYSSMCIAMAALLSYVHLFKMPQGGSVTACSMLFVALVGYWFGPRTGITAAVAYGLLQLFFDGYVVHPLQLILDYPLAFGALGLSGFFANSKHGLYKGYFVGVTGRFICSTLSGIIFFSEYAGGQNVVLYSLAYNFPYMAAEAAISAALVSVPAVRRCIEIPKQQIDEAVA